MLHSEKHPHEGKAQGQVSTKTSLCCKVVNYVDKETWVEHAVWNSQRSDHYRGTGEQAVGTTRVCGEMESLIVPLKRTGLGYRWRPVSLPCVLAWVAVGGPPALDRGSVACGDKGGDVRAPWVRRSTMLAFMFFPFIDRWLELKGELTTDTADLKMTIQLHWKA